MVNDLFHLISKESASTFYRAKKRRIIINLILNQIPLFINDFYGVYSLNFFLYSLVFRLNRI